MSKKTSKKAKPTVAKGVTDVDWTGGGGVTNAFSVQSLRAIDKTLSPSDAYALSIDLHAAIKARNEPLSQGKIRLFYRKSGEEITSGDILNFFANPSPGLSQTAFVFELGAWWDLAGEMICGSIFNDTQLPAGIYPLNPFRLTVQAPTPPRHLSSVQQWRYHYDDGVQVIYPAASVVLLKNFNPNSSVRGLPPVLSGVNEVSSAYEAIAYNRRFFSNNAEPSHIVKLPSVTDPKLIEAFKDEYVANHSIRGGNSHKVMVVGGSDVGIEQVSADVKDASFVGLQQLTSERIFRLYKVPPVHSGQWDKATFDSVEEQNKVFAETVLMPQAERVSQFLQLLVDRFFANASNGRGQGKKLSRTLSAQLEKAKAERVESDIVVLLDLDHLPIISALKSNKLDYAQKLQATFKISPLEAAEEVGFEIEANDANQKIWVTTTETPVDPEDAMPEPPPAAPNASQDTSDDQGTDDASEAKEARTVAMALRKLVLEKLESGKVFKLAEADALNTVKSQKLHHQIRADYLAIKEILGRGEDVKSATKNYLNGVYSRQFLKSL